MNVQAIVRSTLPAVCSGFLTRPCCVVPATLSLVGIGTAGLSAAIVAHRSSFLTASAILLLISLWMNLRQRGSVLNTSLTVFGTIVAFAIGAGWMEVF